MQATAEWVTTLVDLGAPGLVGAALGAFLTYVFGKQLLDDQAKRDEESRVAQVELNAADRAEVALHRLAGEAASIGFDGKNWGGVHKQWVDEVVGWAGRLRNPELQQRINSIGQAIFTATQASDPGAHFGVTRAIENAQVALRAYLAGEELPPPSFPDHKTLMGLLWGDGRGTPNIGAYVDWLTAHP